MAQNDYGILYAEGLDVRWYVILVWLTNVLHSFPVGNGNFTLGDTVMMLAGCAHLF